MNRIVNVARMQLLNRMTYIGIPLIILVGSFALSLIVFAMIPYTGFKYAGGAGFAPIWYYIGAGVYGLTLAFPFSQAMSVTRRDFYLGTLLVAVVSAAVMGIIFMVGGLIEDATNGWGMNGSVFRIPGVWQSEGPLISALIYFTAILFLYTVGFLCAVVYKRWGVAWMVSGLVGIGLILVLIGFIITKLEAWHAVWEALTGFGLPGIVLVGLAFTVVLAGVTYLPLRRTVP